MDRAQAVEDGHQDRPGTILGQAPAVAFQVLGEREPPVIVHHQVGGAVGLEEVAHPHDVGVVDPGQGARLAHELLQPEAKLRALVA
jgi:hypothetical protein